MNQAQQQHQGDGTAEVAPLSWERGTDAAHIATADGLRYVVQRFKTRWSVHVEREDPAGYVHREDGFYRRGDAQQFAAMFAVTPDEVEGSKETRARRTYLRWLQWRRVLDADASRARRAKEAELDGSRR